MENHQIQCASKNKKPKKKTNQKKKKTAKASLFRQSLARSLPEKMRENQGRAPPMEEEMAGSMSA